METTTEKFHNLTIRPKETYSTKTNTTSASSVSTTLKTEVVPTLDYSHYREANRYVQLAATGHHCYNRENCKICSQPSIEREKSNEDHSRREMSLLSPHRMHLPPYRRRSRSRSKSPPRKLVRQRRSRSRSRSPPESLGSDRRQERVADEKLGKYRSSERAPPRGPVADRRRRDRSPLREEIRGRDRRRGDMRERRRSVEHRGYFRRGYGEEVSLGKGTSYRPWY